MHSEIMLNPPYLVHRHSRRPDTIHVYRRGLRHYPGGLGRLRTLQRRTHGIPQLQDLALSRKI